jgi:hypothetical protein
MLDTNLWRYIADCSGFEKLLSESQRNRCALSVAPGSIFEIRELNDAVTRRSILKIAADPRLNKLMPEAYSEARAFVEEIRRLRPEWLIKNPDMKEVNRLRYDWTRRKGGFWENAQLDIAPPVTDESMRSVSELEAARKESKVLRELVQEKYQPTDGNVPLTNVYYSPIDDPNFRPIEYWRASACYLWNSELMIYASPYREWTDSEVDYTAALWNSKSFESFWHVEVKAENMKRQWLRGSFEFLQRWYKVTAGTPGDSMLSSHLAEVDIVLSADKNFIRFAERCENEAPFKTARAIRISAGAAAIDEICDVVNELGGAKSE